MLQRLFSELNPELMEELKTLRSEYARLKEFESKREVDSVQRLEESYDDAKRLSERFKDQFFQTKSELEDTQQQLCESEARGAKLKGEVEKLEKKIKELDDEMKEERLKSHKAALDAERNFQNEKKNLINKGRQDLNDLEEKLTLKIEAERKQHKEKIDRAEVQRIEIENNLSEQLTALREHSSKTLRSTKELGQKMLGELEQSKKAEVEKLSKDKADEIEALITKGKGMIRESRQKAKALQLKITEEYEVKISSLEESLEKVKSIQEEYEQKATAKISKRDHQIKLLEARNRESITANSQLEDKVKKAERSSKELAGENDRLRRQLGSRFGPGGSSQNHLEDLTSVCKSLQEENRRLKEMNPDRSIFANDVRGSKSCNDTTQAITSFSKSALTEFREEYEEKIEELENEKRDLIMKSSAAATETRKAEQRSWELEEELTKVKSELTTAKLALQRNERRSDFSLGLSSSSKHHHEKENTPNVHQDLPPTGAKMQNITPKIGASNSQKKPGLPSLMDQSTPMSDSDQKPECAQS
jgi:myosin heavy subunit